MKSPDSRSGQSIVEIIVAMAIGVILIVGGVATIAPTLKISGDVAHIQTAAALGKELLDNTRVLAESNWHAMDHLSSGSANQYYLVDSASPFAVATGTETVSVATTTYSRWFYLDDVYRNAAGYVDSSGTLDPSARKITVVYTWSTTASNTIVSYLTRASDEVFWNTDWSGGGNQTTAVTVTGTIPRYATSSNIDPTAHPGSIVIQGF